MKNLFIASLVILLCSTSFAQIPGMPDPEPPKPPDQWGHTWSATITIEPGQTIDLYAQLPESCSGGWCRITGRARVNGMETTFVSWARPGTVSVTAITVCTLEVWGK